MGSVRWPSGSEALCAACNQCFHSIELFDKHRFRGGCEDPASLGMIVEDNLWSTVEGHVKRREIGERLSKGRKTKGK